MPSMGPGSQPASRSFCWRVLTASPREPWRTTGWAPPPAPRAAVSLASCASYSSAVMVGGGAQQPQLQPVGCSAAGSTAATLSAAGALAGARGKEREKASPL